MAKNGQVRGSFPYRGAELREQEAPASCSRARGLLRLVLGLTIGASAACAGTSDSGVMSSLGGRARDAGGGASGSSGEAALGAGGGSSGSGGFDGSGVGNGDGGDHVDGAGGGPSVEVDSGGAGAGGIGDAGTNGDAGGTGGAAPVDAGFDAGPTIKPVCSSAAYPMPRPGMTRNVCAGVVRYNWNEGPTWVASQGAFFFSNFPVRTYQMGDIIKYSPSTGRCEVFIEGARCNGLAATNDGNLVGACQGQRAIVKFDLATKMGTVVASMAEGMMLGQPNDLVESRSGAIYFSSPAVRPDRPAGLASAVLRVDSSGVASVVARGDSNGIALSPDEKHLYVVGQGVFDVDAGGALSNKRPFNLGGDGIAVDCAGNIYDSGGSITNPQGQRIGGFPGGTNMAFGGPDGRTLLVVANQNATTVDMNLPGLP